MGELIEGEFEFTGDRAFGYQTKRLLFGNPKKVPLPKVRFLRLNRYKHYRHPTLSKSGWEILGPPRRPSWPEREGLLLKHEMEGEARSRAKSVGVIWCYWWNANQWKMSVPRLGRWFEFRIDRNWDRWIGSVMLLGIVFWEYPKQPRFRLSRAESRKFYLERKREAGEETTPPSEPPSPTR